MGSKKSKQQCSKKKNVARKCVVCKHKCIDDVPKAVFKINYEQMRVTRSASKLLEYIKEFIIVEVYRCMPLLGDEENVPNWDIHICRYAIVFTNKNLYNNIKNYCEN